MFHGATSLTENGSPPKQKIFDWEKNILRNNQPSSSTRYNISELTIQYSSISPLTQKLLELDMLISHIKTSVILQYMLKHIDKDSNTMWEKE